MWDIELRSRSNADLSDLESDGLEIHRRRNNPHLNTKQIRASSIVDSFTSFKGNEKYNKLVKFFLLQIQQKYYSS